MAGKADALRKRIMAAGLSASACTKYLDTLRAFLSARLTKARFEDDMLKVLPRDKIHVHNEIIQDIIQQAQQKRDGLRDLPVVTSLKDRRQPNNRRERPPNRPPGAPVSVVKHPRVGTKRPPDDMEQPNGNVSLPDEPGRKKVKRPLLKNPKEEKAKPTKAKPPEKPSPHVGRPEYAPNLPPPSPAPTLPPRAAPPRASPIQPQEIPSYDSLPYFPVRPGQAMDIELFLKLRQRMKRIAVEQLEMNGVKEDAVALMLHGLEVHVKRVMEAACRQRAGRDGSRPHRNLQCGPVKGYDVREAALRNVGLLGEDAGMDLERLLLQL